MALKSKKKKEEKAVVEKEEKKVIPVDEAPVEGEVPEVNDEAPLTEAEKEAIVKAEEEKTKKSADTRRLQLATNVVSSQFNLDPSYTVNKFDDKGKVVNLTLENSNFIINVTIKDSERHGMHIVD